ncbi:uncharacterized protein F4822DRAFT_250447 [Hypoxylon trugodes]|uniref:uncharacterized protein n=1 Tax=Hypoxylon trugodes TaxID=326681 RepID=UPI00219B8EE5|nr:uncharacterized protein F4822DRAFT_250447 [Hypoxylon trugodes]KAI1388574.1 hypothetical protein F4822DRAFT_250447 [Hypoxylon trugodes]
MKDRLATLASFEFLNYGLPASQPKPDDGLSVKRDAFWSYCGPLLSEANDLPSSLHEWTQAVLSGPLVPILLPFLTYVNEFVKSNGLDNYWLTIRATKATDEFNKPRWHTDDMFFSRNSEFNNIGMDKKAKPKAKMELDLQTDWKLCATLLGPATMFIPSEHQAAARATSRSTKRALATEHICTSIRCVGCAATADAVREQLTSDLAPLGLVQAAPGECSVFRIGQERGAVHSEPCMSSGDRIFVNVVPGRKDELAGLMAKWGMGFPRSWWIAPGVLRAHELM